MSRNPWPFLKKLVKNTFVGCCYVGYTGCCLHLVTEYIIDPVICDGPSMEPTLRSRDLILAEHITAICKDFQHNDIVVLRSPSNPKEFICKRIKGLPGDKVRKNFITTNVVPSGHVWLEGDNQFNSTDSRDYGPVPMGLIRSRVVFRLYPFRDIGFID